jgi:DNA polymerase-3 subunit delta'
MQRRDRTIGVALGVGTLGDAMSAAASLSAVAKADADALTETLDAKEREEAMRSLGLAPGAAIPPQMRAQMRVLEEDQKRRATRSLRDGIDRILTDLLSLYRDVLLTALIAGEAGGLPDRGATGASDGAGDWALELVNREQQARVAELAEGWGPRRALAAVDAVETARERLGRGITPGLVLEALFSSVLVAGDPA